MKEAKEKTVTSVDVARIIKKRHEQLVKEIGTYIIQLSDKKISSEEFFTGGFYTGENNQQFPCYIITEKGCEFIAHKLPGRKGTELIARYINQFHEMKTDMQELEGALKSMRR